MQEQQNTQMNLMQNIFISSFLAAWNTIPLLNMMAILEAGFFSLNINSLYYSKIALISESDERK